MSGFTGTMNDLSFDGKIAAKLLKSKAFDIMKVGIIKWIEVAEREIPIWSGESRGTLIKVGELVGHQVSNIGSTQGQARTPKWRQGESVTDTSLTFKSNIWTFKYKHDEVKQLAINESEDARQWGFRLIKPGPYKFLPQANEAFDEAVQAEIRSFSIRAFFLKNLKVTKVLV